jgi:hypothetical protein
MGAWSRVRIPSQFGLDGVADGYATVYDRVLADARRAAPAA